MKQYKDLDLKKIMDAEDLDFAHWTYGRGQCSCCYGPLDMPARYWKNRKKPQKHYLTDDKRVYNYRLNGEKFSSDSMKYILFINACNGSGTVKGDDLITDYTCIGYRLDYPSQVERVCDMLREQLDDDYVVQFPESSSHCIIIRLKSVLEGEDAKQ